MVKSILFLLLVPGCVHSQSTGAQHAGGSCVIADPHWPGVARDFDRPATLTAIAALDEAARVDRDKLHSGSTNDVGEKLNELYQRDLPSGIFISAGVAELAIRLRQLDCAVRAGRLELTRADAAFAQIAAELKAERAVLEGGGT